jgi:hypothetical protein
MDLESGLFVTDGTGVVINWTVSEPTHPPEFVIVTEYIPANPVLNVCDVPTVNPVPVFFHKKVHPEQAPASKVVESPLQMVRSEPRSGCGFARIVITCQDVSVR